jgi:hypothetical protein
MNDLATLLDHAAGPATASVDAHPDLSRGHRALSRTHRRRSAAGLAGIAAVGALGVALTRGGDHGAAPSVATEPSADPTATPTPTPTAVPTAAPTVDPSAPVTGSAAPHFFDIGTPPAGWVVQGSFSSAVTFARPGDTTVPDDFEGKIVLMLTANRHYGEQRVVDGREFWILDSGDGYTRVTAKTLAGEPKGNLEVQFPTAEWTVDAAIDFLTGVRVLDGAYAVSG